MCVYMYVYIHIRDVHLMTDTIRISIHSQRYDTLKTHMKQVAMRYDSPLFMIQHNAIRCNMMQSRKYDNV